jgi:NAD(P)-dependent dehydrogenase (short-subunit alcohol dehydrogenase family)
VLADVTEAVREGGTPTRALLEMEGADVLALACDVAAERDCEAAVAAAIARHGRLDVLVNNAAVATGAGLLELTREAWDRVLAVNVTGPFLMCRAAIRATAAQEMRGEVRLRIVNLASQHGMVASPGDPAYGVSKAAVAQLTRQIAVDFAAAGVVCNALAPGKILTGKTGRAIAPEMLAYSRARTPWKRLGTPEDVAGAALFLASDDAAFMTGATLSVDGGWMAF